MYCRDKSFDNVWIIGGQTIYEQTINRQDIDYVYITNIHKEYQCDTFFPELPSNFNCIGSFSECEKGLDLLFETFENTNNKCER